MDRLVQADAKFAATLGADVDPDAIAREGRAPVLLNPTEADVARIYLRYRLYTFQPDEMITMMALAGMKPGELKFDPRLYQYGGLFIYPVGALLKLCDMFGLIEVRGDVAYYLDHPDEFGKFYVVARLYAAAWGMAGVFVIFAIARRLGGDTAGLLAAALFSVMPVVVCMSHEGKPHLPGAVLMLAAVYCGIRAVGEGDRGLGAGSQGTASRTGEGSARWHSGKCFWLMCICCGAALGMVLSSAPIFVLIPLIAWMRRGVPAPTNSRLQPQTTASQHAISTPAPAPRPGRERGLSPLPSGSTHRPFLARIVGGVGLGFVVYLLSNPYIVINLFANRQVLRSNFGNSLAMYEVSRIADGFVRVLELTVEGATLPVLMFGVLALLVAVLQRHRTALVLAVPAAVFFVQFVLIGAGKPAEYGRFGIFPNSALAIGTACLLANAWSRRRSFVPGAAIVVVMLWVAVHGAAYLRNFWLDTTDHGSRMVAARMVAEKLPSLEVRPTVTVYAEPAPYSCPPMDFARTHMMLLSEAKGLKFADVSGLQVFVDAVDAIPDRSVSEPDASPRWLSWLPGETPISWANKPFIVEVVAGP